MQIKIQPNILGGKFLSDDELRIHSISTTINEFVKEKENLIKNTTPQLSDGIQPVLYIKGYGNNPQLYSHFNNIFINSRQLLDSLLLKLNKTTNATSTDTSKFFYNLLQGNYDKLNLPIIVFLQDNFTYIYHIRKIRNLIKQSPSTVKFLLVTNHIEAYFDIPIEDSEMKFLPYLDIKNKEVAITKNQYSCTLNLDAYFPEIVGFWKEVQQYL